MGVVREAWAKGAKASTQPMSKRAPQQWWCVSTYSSWTHRVHQPLGKGELVSVLADLDTGSLYIWVNGKKVLGLDPASAKAEHLLIDPEAGAEAGTAAGFRLAVCSATAGDGLFEVVDQEEVDIESLLQQVAQDAEASKSQREKELELHDHRCAQECVRLVKALVVDADQAQQGAPKGGGQGQGREREQGAADVEQVAEGEHRRAVFTLCTELLPTVADMCQSTVKLTQFWALFEARPARTLSRLALW